MEMAIFIFRNSYKCVKKSISIAQNMIMNKYIRCIRYNVNNDFPYFSYCFLFFFFPQKSRQSKHANGSEPLAFHSMLKCMKVSSTFSIYDYFLVQLKALHKIKSSVNFSERKKDMNIVIFAWYIVENVWKIEWKMPKNFKKSHVLVG